MKSFIQTVSEIEKKITVSLTKADFDAYTCRNGQIKDFSENSELFPQSVPSAVKNKIFEITEDIFSKQNIQPLEVTRFALKESKNDEFVFSAYYAVLPSVNLDLAAINIPVPPPVLPQELYDCLVRSIQKKHKTIKEKKDFPQYGDTVFVSVQGSINNRPAPCLTIQNKEFEFSEANFFKIDFGVDFSELLTAMRAGEQKDFYYTFRSDYPEVFLRNKTLSLKVFLHDCRKTELPLFDDNLAKKEGFESLRQFEDILKNSALKIHLKKVRELGKQKLMEELLKQADFPMLNCILQRCIAEYKKKIYAILQNYGAAEKETEETLAAMKDVILENAAKQAKAEILLLSSAQQNNLNISQQELQTYIEDEAQKNNVSPKRMEEFLIKNKLMTNIYDRLLTEKSLNYLYDHTKKQW